MKAVIQRVSSAYVQVDGKKVGAINKGLLVLLGIHQNDTDVELKWMSDKILKLRIFEDSDEKMNLSVSDVEGEILVVSQFTLYGDAKKGTRPSFIESARPEKAEPMYDRLVNYLRDNSDLKVETGIFGAMMEVSLVNDGPVTIILEK